MLIFERLVDSRHTTGVNNIGRVKVVERKQHDSRHGTGELDGQGCAV